MTHMELTHGAETVRISVWPANDPHAMVFHHDKNGECKMVHVHERNGKLAPVGILFGFNEKTRTAAAEAVVRFENGQPVIERKGLKVQVS